MARALQGKATVTSAGGPAKIAPAARIVGLKQREDNAVGPLVVFSESDELPVIPEEQSRDLLAWRRRVEKLAADDPEAYDRVCRFDLPL